MSVTKCIPQTDRTLHPAFAWLAVTTKPRQEHIAQENLQNQNFETYLPKISLNKHRNGRWQLVTEVLFPGYIFVNVDLANQNTAPIRSTVGVRGLVKFGSRVVPVNDEVIEFIRSHELAQDEHTAPPASQFKRGDKLEIVSGPFKGLSALFDTPKSDERVMVLLTILGSQKALAIDIDAVIAST